MFLQRLLKRISIFSDCLLHSCDGWIAKPTYLIFKIGSDGDGSTVPQASCLSSASPQPVQNILGLVEHVQRADSSALHVVEEPEALSLCSRLSGTQQASFVARPS